MQLPSFFLCLGQRQPKRWTANRHSRRIAWASHRVAHKCNMIMELWAVAKLQSSPLGKITTQFWAGLSRWLRLSIGERSVLNSDTNFRMCSRCASLFWCQQGGIMYLLIDFNTQSLLENVAPCSSHILCLMLVCPGWIKLDWIRLDHLWIGLNWIGLAMNWFTAEKLNWTGLKFDPSKYNGWLIQMLSKNQA